MENIKVETMIWVTFQHEGFHAFDRAKTDKKLSDVDFLANRHRHIFHCNVTIDVKHDDRDIEFIQFKRFMEQFTQYDNASCEQICKRLYDHIVYNSGIPEVGKRRIIISVAEDGENGANVVYTPVQAPVEMPLC